MGYRILKQFNIKNPQHLAVLRFVARWKYISVDMVQQRWPKLSLTHIRELLNVMAPSKVITKNGKPKTIWYGQLRKVTDTSFTGGKKTTLYTVTWKGAKEANLPYHIEVSVRDNIKVGKHTLNCLKVINELGLDENQYFTEFELWTRYQSFKKEQGMEVKPRMCDFAYIKDGKFIGVEIENHIKNYKEYVAPNFNGNFGIEAFTSIKKDVKQWGYFDGTSIYPTILKIKDVALSKAKQAAIELGIDKNIVFNPLSFGTIKKYKLTFENGGEMEFDGISVNQLKDMLSKHEMYKDRKVCKAELVKNEDCIFYRHMYALNMKFYNEIHWYLPKDKVELFKTFVDKAFYMLPDHDFFKIFSITDDQEVQQTVDINNLTSKF